MFNDDKEQKEIINHRLGVLTVIYSIILIIITIAVFLKLNI